MHSLLFIRENEGQLTGSDCCGKLEGDWRVENGRPVFGRQRATITDLAPLFLAVQASHPGQIEVQQIDPRNLAFLLPRLIADVWRRKRLSLAACRSLLMLYRLPAIIFDGELLFSGRVPTREEFYARLPAPDANDAGRA